MSVRNGNGKHDSVTVWPIGCRVEFKDGGQEGTITGLTIRDAGAVRYEVTYWTSSGRCEAWVEALEVKPLDQNTGRRIGFSSMVFR